MKDIMKMSSKQRNEYLSSINVDNELIKADEFRIIISNDRYYCLPNLSQLIRKAHKLLYGHNRIPSKHQDKINLLLVYLIVFENNDLYDKFIKESESL